MRTRKETRREAGRLLDPHERECASAAIAARLEKAKTPSEKREWRKLRRDMLGN